MRVLDPWYAVWSDAEVCDWIRALHHRQAQRVAALAENELSVPRTYVPRACDQEIIPIANFGSGLQYFSPARQKIEHLLALQERLRPLLESGQLNAWQFLFICNHRPERVSVLERCLEAGARLFRDTGTDHLEAPAAKDAYKPMSNETVRLLLEAVTECLPPGTNCEEIDADGNYLPVDASLAQPFAYAPWLGERRTQLDAEMEQLERSKQQRVGASVPEQGKWYPEASALADSMQRARAFAEQRSLVEVAERFAGADLLGPRPESFEALGTSTSATNVVGGRHLHQRTNYRTGSYAEPWGTLSRQQSSQSLRSIQELAPTNDKDLDE
ncbi:hypothetical protein CCYA_CCYA09G2729 [Cyanidiococcus yangmingshanensis]|nr:hypothetical protein CCYA_CCYA09G2729 [Cyanidiococcus yangmingshanensis]